MNNIVLPTIRLQHLSEEQTTTSHGPELVESIVSYSGVTSRPLRAISFEFSPGWQPEARLTLLDRLWLAQGQTEADIQEAIALLQLLAEYGRLASGAPSRIGWCNF